MESEAALMGMGLGPIDELGMMPVGHVSEGQSTTNT